VLAIVIRLSGSNVYTYACVVLDLSLAELLSYVMGIVVVDIGLEGNSCCIPIGGWQGGVKGL
jgi:hypothetical protein